MSALLEAEILAASQPLRLPGAGERRVLTPAAVERLAAAAGKPRWEVEVAALETDVAPLRYLRNLSEFGTAGQARLIQSPVGIAGTGAAAERLAEMLAGNGVSRFVLLLPPGGAPERIAAAAVNRNASAEIETRELVLTGGNPVQAVSGLAAVAACLEDSREEQLLQFACRMARVPLVLGGVEALRGQATTIFPGDPGVALVYRPSHPHLEPVRTGAAADPKATLMVGTWLAEQTTRVLLDEGELLRGRLLYADMDTGEMDEYPL